MKILSLTINGRDMGSNAVCELKGRPMFADYFYSMLDAIPDTDVEDEADSMRADIETKLLQLAITGAEGGAFHMHGHSVGFTVADED